MVVSYGSKFYLNVINIVIIIIIIVIIIIIIVMMVLTMMKIFLVIIKNYIFLKFDWLIPATPYFSLSLVHTGEISTSTSTSTNARDTHAHKRLGS